MREVVDELAYDRAKLVRAASEHQYLDALPLSTGAYRSNEHELARTLPFEALRSTDEFYRFADEVDGDPSGLVGAGGRENFVEMQRLVESALRQLAPYIG